MATKDNLAIYNALRVVPENAKKPAKICGMTLTDINPMWRIKALTEQFGAAGEGWWFDVVKRETMTMPNGDIITLVAVNLFYKKENGETSAPLYGEGGNFIYRAASQKVDDDGYKKALTDAIGIAAKQIGCGADVWFEKDAINGTKYAAAANDPDLQQTAAPAARQAQPAAQNGTPVNVMVARLVSAFCNIEGLEGSYRTWAVGKYGDAASDKHIKNWSEDAIKGTYAALVAQKYVTDKGRIINPQTGQII